MNNPENSDKFETCTKLNKSLEEISRQLEAATQAFKKLIQGDEESGGTTPGPHTAQALEEIGRLRVLFADTLKQFQEAVGISEASLEAIEREEIPKFEDRWYRKEILEVDPTGDLDIAAASGLKSLLALVDREWLKLEARKDCRLEGDFRTFPIHLVNGLRFRRDVPRPQRFARMLLATSDHLAKRTDLDFFEAPMLIAEVAALGARLEEVTKLGPEATEKLRRLPQMSDDEVASSVYELLVGTAGVLRGLSLEMLPPEKSRKTPDFRVTGLHVPTSLECKRRLGLTEYELDEWARVRELYGAVRESLSRAHASLEVSFTEKLTNLETVSFCDAVLPLLETPVKRRELTTTWGAVVVEPLPGEFQFNPTRLYSPDFLAKVFGFRPDDGVWDGFSGQVEPPSRLIVDRARNPHCLKWVSRNADAAVKKSRGVTSLWANAMKQIPAGELGLIYIAYPEVNRSEMANARTDEILQACRRWHERWSVSIGATVINRFYPRAIGMGVPDLIENSVPLVSLGNEHLLSRLPTLVMAPSRRP